jgi:hypothetical protein
MGASRIGGLLDGASSVSRRADPADFDSSVGAARPAADRRREGPVEMAEFEVG